MFPYSYYFDIENNLINKEHLYKVLSHSYIDMIR